MKTESEIQARIEALTQLIEREAKELKRKDSEYKEWDLHLETYHAMKSKKHLLEWVLN